MNGKDEPELLDYGSPHDARNALCENIFTIVDVSQVMLESSQQLHTCKKYIYFFAFDGVQARAPCRTKMQLAPSQW